VANALAPLGQLGLALRHIGQIEGVIAPHPLEGVYKQTMVNAMLALRKRKSLIMDTCEIFVKEPLLDWVKDAK
jgi:DNA-dependent protein kinase catalytic subunit